MFRPAAHTYSATFYGQYDPTRTLTLRNRFAKEAKRRFKALNRAVRTAILEHDILAGGIQTMAAQRNDNPSEVIRKFLEWLSRQENREILAANGITDEMWTDTYSDQAYRQGVKRARAEMSRAGYQVPPINDAGGVDALMVQPIHQDMAKILGMEMRTNIQTTATNMNMIIGKLLNGAVPAGRDPSVIADQITKIMTNLIPDVPLPEINERFMSGMQRTIQIGRTGVVKSHHIATIKEYEQWGVEGVQVMAEFVTAGDDRVCERCKTLEAKGPYALEEVITMIPAHYGCRCVALPMRKE